MKFSSKRSGKIEKLSLRFPALDFLVRKIKEFYFPQRKAILYTIFTTEVIMCVHPKEKSIISAWSSLFDTVYPTSNNQ